MTDLNEKLKLVAEYYGCNTKLVYSDFHEKEIIQDDCRCGMFFNSDFDLDYTIQTRVWQKALKEIQSYNFEYMSTEWQRFGELWTLYHDAIDKAAPLESFEILVQAIIFINKMKK